MIFLKEEEVNNFRNSHTKLGVKLFHFIALCGLIYGFYLLIFEHLKIKIIILPLLIIYILSSSLKLFVIFFIISYILININYKLNIYNTIILIFVSYLLTDLSHIIFNEPTYRSKYNNEKEMNYILKKVKHHLYLPLLILDSVLFKPCYFKSGSVEINKDLIEYTNNINVNKKFTNKKINIDHDLDMDHGLEIDNIIQSFLSENNLNHKYEKIPEIDELYITNCKFKSSNLDKVVDDYHIDGHIPNIFGIRTYRLLILLQKDKNDKSQTIFKHYKQLKNTNYIIFDYNSQVHRADIATDYKNISKNRVMFKIHFITYSPFIPNKCKEIYKKLLILTNRLMRKTQEKNKNYYFLPKLKKEILRPIEIL